GSRWSVAADLVGARDGLRPELSDPAPGVVSYFKGPRTQWHTGLATFREIAYRGVWPGIDLVYRADGSSLKYEFRVAPGADPSRIGIAWRGAESVRLDGAGRLCI